MELPMEPRSAVLGVADACLHPHWGLRRMWFPTPLGHQVELSWGHEAPYWVWQTHAPPPSPLGPSVELLMWPRSA
eukprot:1086888-Pyramimonas_sp.AAC.1